MSVATDLSGTFYLVWMDNRNYPEEDADHADLFFSKKERSRDNFTNNLLISNTSSQGLPIHDQSYYLNNSVDGSIDKNGTIFLAWDDGGLFDNGDSLSLFNRVMVSKKEKCVDYYSFNKF